MNGGEGGEGGRRNPTHTHAQVYNPFPQNTCRTKKNKTKIESAKNLIP
jgi:hypothetical protein